MKNKIGCNFLFAIMAFPVGMALAREYNLENSSFKNPGLGMIYLVTFIGLTLDFYEEKLKLTIFCTYLANWDGHV